MARAQQWRKQRRNRPSWGRGRLSCARASSAPPATAGAQGYRVTAGQAAGGPGAHPEARFAAEREFSRQPDVEDMVPGGESWQFVKRTHPRYFSDGQDLATAGPQRRAIAISQSLHLTLRTTPTPSINVSPADTGQRHPET